MSLLRLLPTALFLISLTAGAPVMAQSPADPAQAQGALTPDSPVTIPQVDPARLQISLQIVENLKLMDLITHGARMAISSEPALQSLTESQKSQMSTLMIEELEKSRPDLTRLMAASAVGTLTVDQLNDILVLSKIKFMQQSVLAGADPSVTPDPTTMTPEEKANMDRLGSQPYVTQYFANIDYTSLMSLARQAGMRAGMRFRALQAAPK